MKRKFWTKNLRDIVKCVNCGNGQLEDFGDLKRCDRCGTEYREGTPPDQKETVMFT